MVTSTRAELAVAQKKVEEEARKRSELKGKSKAQQSLMGYIAHEIRAPLHALKALIYEVLHAPEMPTSITDDVGMMAQSADQMSLVINDVLDLVSVSAQRGTSQGPPQTTTTDNKHRPRLVAFRFKLGTS